MRKSTQLVLALSVAYAMPTLAASGPLKKLDDSTLLRLAKLASDALNIMSSDWSSESAKRSMNDIGYDASASTYDAMLKRESHLGKFKACNDMQYGKPTDMDIEGAIAFFGSCKFENGPAKVIIVFVPIHGKDKVVSILVGN